MGCDAVTAAVVLAGGAARRFGADKLQALWEGTPLLDHLLGTLPSDWRVVVVGPSRPTTRTVIVIREDPPGCGPAAGLLTGLRATGEAEVVVTMPGDAPHAARVASALLDRLGAGSDEAVAAGDPEPNPLHLALRGAALTRARALDPTAWANRSARSLMAVLDPAPVPVPASWLHDVDVPADLSGPAR